MTRDEALRAARNDDWKKRKEAAAALAQLASYEDYVAHTALMRLLLDEYDTAITLEAAEELLKRNDLYSASTVFSGLALATNSEGDWIVNAIHSAWKRGQFDAEYFSEQIMAGTDALPKFGASDYLNWAHISDTNTDADVKSQIEWYRANRN